MEQTIIALGAGVFFIIAASVLGAYVLSKWGLPVARTALEAYWSERWGVIDERLRDIEEDVGSLPRVWEEFATDAKKAQERARWHVRRAKKELETRGFGDAELDTLDSEIRARDGAGGNGSGLPELFDHVEEVPTAPANPMNEVLKRKWGNV